ncbi:MAG TPA: hypothetical protein VHB20_08885 [Verrucomicrobiae bacterium]|jgi:hypothetical protein|nr:hypothetical protein [Verrucomicrobiae bacterium]
MSFIFALLLWLIIAALLVTGIVMSVSGHFWLLGIGSFLFIASMTKEGILNH